MTKEKVKILIIEDDSFLLSMYATKFELENFEVITAEDGEKGLKIAAKELPRIILLDILLPKMNGFEVLKTLKETAETKDIKVILLTNLSQRGEVEQGLTMGAVDYLIKAHFMPSEVVEKVKKILSQA
ncbi:MAG: PAS/PAC sensor hybrid histidine kinase [Parcubacteria group bacterium GW2011_GWE2_39_37]|uniref:PAS/PAC sensor hybrid histidine kinase n=1 Tax=Candidatus Falkowbacteria bacterium GW2011_GWF2_39_8 TaxID=1618642 RepID=A0A0G0SD18_9BACT|nr:MAG: PAS/PAC sensor hybrid histidine kinase [Parcubacteria group bacterium GW2011_GWE2_39_37]KKR32590.1 MAG: PAS/PAC sensor hybrid histidine kinase [Candidatus Falkowbacteria bacterium GW2011_GWF2_39_8]